MIPGSTAVSALQKAVKKFKDKRDGSEPPSADLADDTGDALSITTRYSRPSGATTRAQRESVQGQPCVDCGKITDRQVADRIEPLVVEFYRTGTIDLKRMRSLNAVQPQCPTCSARQGTALSRYFDRDAKAVGTGMNQDPEYERAVAERYGVLPVPVDTSLKVGIARNVRTDLQPVNALRHPPEGDTSGWYIWAGELSDDPDFFVPLHVSHLAEWCPQILPFLCLPPGWRVLIAPSYEDVWFDEALL